MCVVTPIKSTANEVFTKFSMLGNGICTILTAKPSSLTFWIHGWPVQPPSYQGCQFLLIHANRCHPLPYDSVRRLQYRKTIANVTGLQTIWLWKSESTKKTAMHHLVRQTSLKHETSVVWASKGELLYNFPLRIAVPAKCVYMFFPENARNFERSGSL